MRIFSAALLLVVTACAKPADVPPGDTIPCALDGAAAFSQICTLERDGDALTVHRPDGGFRRFVRTPQGVTTDGAEAAELQSDGSVKIGADRYRLPK